MFACWNWWGAPKPNAAELVAQDTTRSSIIVRSGANCNYGLFERALRGHETGATLVNIQVAYQEDRYGVTVYELNDAVDAVMAAQTYQRDALVFPFDATNQKSFDELFTRFNFLELMLRPNASFPDRIWIVGVLQTQDQRSRNTEFSQLIEAFQSYLSKNNRPGVSVIVKIVYLDDTDALRRLITSIVVHSLKISEPAQERMLLSPELQLTV